MIVTFYSFKGGVGRSMAVANVGDILARRGFRVLLIDFDLEAPGLEQYFQINQAAARRHQGLLDLLLTYKRSMSVAASGGDDQFEQVDRFIVPVYERLPGGARLDLMPAGEREGREPLDRYAANLRSFDWQDFYNRWEGELFFEWLRGALVPERYDLVLVDSRTGVTEMGGICTYQLADAIFMLSAANHQNRQGTLNVAADFLSLPVQSARRQRPLDILAVPARVEQRDPDLAGPFLEQFSETFAAFLPARVRDAGLDFGDLLIPYDPSYAFEERVISDPARSPDRRSIGGAFERLADAVCALVSEDAPAAARARQYTKAKGGQAAPAPVVQFDAAKRYAGYDVFLSYAAGDAEAARALSGRLRQAGLVVFEDRVDVAPGEDWRARTGQALFHSKTCLVCCGREGLTRFQASDLMAAVRGAAAVRELILIPVLLPNANVEAFRALAPPELLSRLPIDLQHGLDHDVSARQLDLFVGSLTAAPAVGAASATPATAAPKSVTTVFGAPYPGARAFTEADVQFFFGREKTRDQLRDGLRRDSVVVLTGPSASGKTSLVEAGLVPKLRSEPMPLAYERVVPGEKPDEELRQALARLQALPGGRRLLFLDQLERLLRLVSTDRARAFLTQVGAIIADPDAPDVVIALRDVRLEGLGALAPAGLLSDARRLAIPPLTEDEMRAAVLRPAECAGLAFEPGLVDRIIGDWGQDQRFLPFLQRVLHDLWTRRREGFLTNDAYDAIPDPVEAIGEHAWATLDASLKPMAQRVIPRIITLCGNLTTFDAGCRPDELVLGGMDQVSLRAVLWHMVDHGVLYAYVDAGRKARVAPSFTVEQWDRAQAWVHEQGPLLEWLSTLHHHRIEWERSGRDADALLGGRLLDEAIEKRRTSGADLSGLDVDFIHLSEGKRARQRRFQYQVGAGVTLLILLLLGGNWWRQQEAAKARASTRAAVAALLEEGDRTAAAGDRGAALDAYSRAIALDADDKTTLMRRAATLDASGRYDEAIADLDRVIALTPADGAGETSALLTDAYLARGTVHLHRQDLTAALADFDAAVRRDASNPVAHASRGSVLEQLKRDDDAAAAYTRALELDNDFADAAFARGVLYQRQQRLAQAASDFTHVSTLPTASPATQLAARSRLEQLGRVVTASAQKTRVLLSIGSEQDREVAKDIAASLELQDFDIQGIRLARPSLRGDVRYYFREDERAAETVRLAAESLIAARGYNVRLESRFLSTKEAIQPGLVEVWLPPFAAQGIPVSGYAPPASIRRK